jgi:hypothetical protein
MPQQAACATVALTASVLGRSRESFCRAQAEN